MIFKIKAKKASIFVSGCRHSAAEVRRQTGADLVLNGGLYNMRTLQPCCHMVVDGVELARDPYNYKGYGWERGTAKLRVTESTNKGACDYYICCNMLVRNHAREDLYYNPAQGGRRGNIAIGTMDDGTIVVCAHQDGKDPVTPEELQEEMLNIGCKDALALDGGGSVQVSTEGKELRSARKVHNYVCFWGEEEEEKPKEEETSMNEKQLREKFVDVARHWIGLNERDGSHGKIIDVYNAQKPLPVGYKVRYTDDWCAAFVSACGVKAGLGSIIYPECGCERMIKLYMKHGCWMENDDYIPKSGDIIMYDWQAPRYGDAKGWADHTGIVESCDGKHINLIEGNLSNAVTRKTISVNDRKIRGFCLPDFASLADGAEDIIVPEAADTWAATACAKAVSHGIVQGDGTGHYGWKNPITKQELMVVLDRLGLL